MMVLDNSHSGVLLCDLPGPCHDSPSQQACLQEQRGMADWQLQSQGCRLGQLQKEVSVEKCVMCLEGIIVAGGKMLRNSAQGRSFWLHQLPPRVLSLF